MEQRRLTAAEDAVLLNLRAPVAQGWLVDADGRALSPTQEANVRDSFGGEHVTRRQLFTLMRAPAAFVRLQERRQLARDVVQRSALEATSNDVTGFCNWCWVVTKYDAALNAAALELSGATADEATVPESAPAAQEVDDGNVVPEEDDEWTNRIATMAIAWARRFHAASPLTRAAMAELQERSDADDEDDAAADEHAAALFCLEAGIVDARRKRKRK